jgi:hypothetical protein
MCPLGVAAIDFRFQARQQMRMPGYMGSAGGFGRAPIAPVQSFVPYRG